MKKIPKFSLFSYNHVYTIFLTEFDEEMSSLIWEERWWIFMVYSFKSFLTKEENIWISHILVMYVTSVL